MKLSFRELASNDIDACLAIVKKIYTKESEKESWNVLPKDLSGVLNKAYPSKCLVAAIKNKIIGFGCYIKIDEKLSAPNIFYKLTWINIHPKYQGKGVGKSLVSELERHIGIHCKENLSVILETDKPGFYGKLGYETYNKNGENDLMQKIVYNIHRPKILVGTIFSDVKDYAIRDYFKTVCSFSYKNFDFCAVDNSVNKKYHHKIFKYFSDHKNKSNIGKLTVLRTPRVSNKSDVFMAFSANELRKKFLEGSYDALLYLECDIHPPVDIIEKLMNYNKPVISAIYFTGEKSYSYSMIADTHYFIYGNPRMHIKSYMEGFFDIEECDKPKELSSAGLGCVLMHRSVVQRIPFRHSTEHNVHHDGTFAQDLLFNGIQNMYVPIMCRHDNQTWDIQHKMIGN